jgi:hypothetical protein
MNTVQLEDPTVGHLGNSNGGGDRERLAALRQQFVIGSDVIQKRMVACMEKLVPHCGIDERGMVELKSHIMGAKQQIKTVLAARAVAARLEDANFNANVTMAELEASTGIDHNVISARCGEMVKSKEIEQVSRGVWTFRSDKVEKFLDTLAASK